VMTTMTTGIDRASDELISCPSEFDDDKVRR
jgi:hypothetical protein